METTEKAPNGDPGLGTRSHDDVLAFSFRPLLGWDQKSWQPNGTELNAMEQEVASGRDENTSSIVPGNAADFYKLNLFIWFDN